MLTPEYPQENSAPMMETDLGPEASGLSDAPAEGKPLDLLIRLPDEKMKALANRVYLEIARYISATEQRRSNLKQWRLDWELYPTGRSMRWPGASDIPSHLTHVYVNNHHTRLNQQIVRAVPPFTAVPRTLRALEVASDIEEAMTSRLEDADWEETADQVHLELPLAGNVGLRVTYEQRIAHVPRHKWEIDEEAYKLLLESQVDPNDAFWEVIEKDEDGNPKAYLEYDDEDAYTGVVFQVVPWEDLVVLPCAIRDPKEAYGIGERMNIRGVDLRLGAEDGKYFKDAVADLLETRAGPQPEDRTEALEVQGISDYGSQGSSGEFDSDYEDYLCYELCWLMDCDNDGKMEWVVITLHWDSKAILRLQHCPYEHGEPYYHLFRYYPRVRELFHMGVAEKLAPYQDASTAVVNQIIDHADYVLNMTGNFFYDQSAGFDPAKQNIRLGKPIQVDSIDGIKPIQVAPLSPEHYNVAQFLKEVGDLLTATSNPALGKMTESSKTLGEVQMAAAGSGMQFEEVASRVARTWAKVFDQCRKLEAQYAQDGIVHFRRKVAPTGDIIGQIPRELLLEEVKLVPTGLKQLADMQSRVQQATIVQNTLLQHPLTMGDIDVMVTCLDVYLQSVNYPQREKIMEAVYRKVNALLQEQQMAAQMAEMGMAPPGGDPSEQQNGNMPPPPKEAAVPKQNKAERIMRGDVNGAGLPTQPPI